MSTKLQMNRSLIDPIYSQIAPNETIQLGEVSLQFSRKDKTYDETALVTMQFLPDRRLLFVVPAKEKPERTKGQAMTAEEMKEVLCSMSLLQNLSDNGLLLLSGRVLRG